MIFWYDSAFYYGGGQCVRKGFLKINIEQHFVLVFLRSGFDDKFVAVVLRFLFRGILPGFRQPLQQIRNLCLVVCFS